MIRFLSSYTKLSLILSGCFFFLASLTDAQSGLPHRTNSDTTGLLEDSSFQILYGAQRKDLSVQSIGEAYTPALEKSISTSFGGLLAGQLAGLLTSQSSGEPGNDGVLLSLRGQSPLILIDGIPQSSIGYLNPEQIASVTVLKDAVSTAMLGMRGSGGAVLITTKKGSESPQHISFTAIGGIQRPLKMPQVLNAYQYASLYNEALANDGKAPFYSQSDLNAYQSGSDPIGHPDVNWQKEVLKNQAAFDRFDLNISGGGKVAKYFVDLGYLGQQGLFKTAGYNTYNTNVDDKQYVFRSNVSVEVSKDITTYLNIFGLVGNKNEPGVSTTSIFNNLLTTPANAYPVFNPDGSLGGNQNYQNNIYGQVVNSGYQLHNTLDGEVNLALKGNLDDLLKGLWVKGTVSFISNLIENIDRSKPFVTFQMQELNGDTAYQQFGSTTDQANTGSINDREKMFYAELALGYSKHFAGQDLQVELLGNHNNIMEGDQLSQNFDGLAGRVTYDLKQKYILEGSLAYNGTNEYMPGKRYGAFPAAALGWVLSREGFLQRQSAWLDVLKLRVSYGKTGNAVPSYFAYNQYYVGATNYNFGESPSSAHGVAEDTLANPNLSWEKANKFNVGIDAAFFHHKLALTLEYFDDKYYDLLQQPGNNTALLGGAYPQENLGINRFSGSELQLSYQDHIGAFQYFISPNISLLKTKVLFQDEVYRPYTWMQHTGRPVGQPFGYIAQGLFQSEEQISASAVPVGYLPVPGDIRYKDLNGDGVIDENDQTAIGSTAPLIYYGCSIGFNWKGFDFSALIQGVTNRNLLLTGDYEWEFQNNGRGQAFVHNLGRWTPENAQGATYPRLSVGSNPNNDQNSTYWMHSGDYARLKSIEVGYSLSESVIRHLRLKAFRIFLNGTNLITLAAYKQVDPESYTGGYPIMKMLNAGVNIQF